MTNSLDELKARFAALPEAERLELAHDVIEFARYLVETVKSPADESADVAWDAVLAGRAAEIEGGWAQSIPAKSVKPVVFHSGAMAELEEAADYYETDPQKRSRDLRLEIVQTIARIQSQPDHYPLHQSTPFRKCPLGRAFPYTVYYCELNDRIWIAAIAHQKRRPGNWAERRPQDL